MRTRQLAIITVLSVCGLGVAACGSDSKESSTPTSVYAPHIDPAEFSTTIDNPYLPLVPGTRMIYEGKGEEGQERTVVEVTRDTKTVMGIPAVVVHDMVTVGGKVIEDTYDWYAQQRDGSVWYLGEDTKEFENGQVSGTKGSWEGGVKGAQPGIAMPAHPVVGQRFQEEYYEGEAEDMGEVLSVTETATVPYGSYSDVVKTQDTTPLEPDLREERYYARGVGLVLAADVAGGSDRSELVAVEHF